MKHARETLEHIRMKELIAKFFTLLGWLILFEEKLADVVVWRIGTNGRMRILAIEAERTNRHALSNAKKDLKHGCDCVLSIVLTEHQRVALRRKLKSELPREIWIKAGIMTVEQISRNIQRREKLSS